MLHSESLHSLAAVAKRLQAEYKTKSEPLTRLSMSSSSTIAAASTASSSSSSSSTSSPRCVPFAFRRGGGARGRLLPAPAPAGARTPAVAAHGGAPAAGGCGRPLCRAAEVLGGGIQSAFFASLDGCSCVEVRTQSFKESESEVTTPLMQSLPSPSPPHGDSSSAAGAAVRSFGTRRRRTAAASVGGNKPRRGLGCCTPNSTSVN